MMCPIGRMCVVAGLLAVLASAAAGAEPPAALSERVESELAAVNRSMSTYLPDSELESFNRHGLGPFDRNGVFDLAGALEAAPRMCKVEGTSIAIIIGGSYEARGQRFVEPGQLSVSQLGGAS